MADKPEKKPAGKKPVTKAAEPSKYVVLKQVDAEIVGPEASKGHPPVPVWIVLAPEVEATSKDKAIEVALKDAPLADGESVVLRAVAASRWAGAKAITAKQVVKTDAADIA